MQQQGWNCIYHEIHGMRVVSDNEKQVLMESGAWFDSPLKAKLKKEGEENEKQIRRKPR